uniref:TMC domain-containing protein n=1 Tax=Meloidogyne incognita TaxID=6306 RepID=A0A914KFQ7_MELIC
MGFIQMINSYLKKFVIHCRWLIFCQFFLIAKNARISKLSGTKAEQYVFNWKLFTGWDYSIGSAETAQNTAMAVVIKLREAINECHSYAGRACIPSRWAIRIVTNTVIIGMIALSVYCIQAAMRSSETVEKSSGSLFTKNQVPLLMSTITHIFPMIFDLIGRGERHHARTALRLHLIRISALYIINYVTLMLSLFEKLDNIRDISRVTATTLLDESAENTADYERWNSNSNHQTQQFYSRNFSSPNQLKQFFMDAFNFVTRQHGRRQAENGGEEIGKLNVDGTSVTVRAQFGPVGVNNPTVLLRNYTQHPVIESDSFETRKIGPTPLPLFTPPPIPPTSRTSTFREQNFGPNWKNSDAKSDKERWNDERDHKSSTTPILASTVPNITVKRPIDGLPFAKIEKMPTLPMGNGGEERSTIRGNGRLTSGDVTSRTHNQQRLSEIVKPEATTSTAIQTTMVHSTDWINDDDDIENNVHYNEEICWETMLGQEIVKLVTMDLYITIISIFLIDFVRGIWIRYCSSWWCWDIETTFPEYGEFKVAENVLHICNNQGMVWLGLFFTPLLPAINSFKLICLMYIRGWACTTCNVPAREIFRASRSSSFFLYILLSALLLCIVPVGYVITVKRPSILCGPFAGQSHFYAIVTDLIKGHVNRKVLRWVRYLTSPGVIFPFILLLVLFIFFLFSLVRGLRKANSDLQNQLIHERTEEKRKIFELAGGGTRKKGPSSFGASTVRAAANLLQPHKSGSQRKMIAGQHLPEVEKKRREPWRIFRRESNSKDNHTTLSFCPSDEPPSSLNSPISIEAPVLESLAKNQATLTQNDKKQQHPSIIPLNATNGRIRPSISSVEKFDRQSIHSSSDTLKHASPKKLQNQQPSTAAIINLRNGDGQPRRFSGDGYNISEGTPETVRKLIAQHQNSSQQQQKQLNIPLFPIDLPSIREDISSIKEPSCSVVTCKDEMDKKKPVPELSEFKVKETESSKATAKSSSNLKRHKIIPNKLNLTQCLNRQTSITSPVDADVSSKNNITKSNEDYSVVLSDEVSDTYDFINAGIPSGEAPHRISLYSREPRRIGAGDMQQIFDRKQLPMHSLQKGENIKEKQTSKQRKQTAAKQSHSPADSKPRRLSMKSHTSSESNVLPAGMSSQFAPMTSPDEIKNQQRTQLLRPTSIGPISKIRHIERGGEINKNIPTPSTSSLQSTSLSLKQQSVERQNLAKSPSKMIKSIHSGELPRYRQSRQMSPPRRFRITVSPTRQMTIINQEVEMIEEQHPTFEESQKKSPRRTVIKQQVFTGSTSTFGDPVSGLGEERGSSLTAACRRLNQKQHLGGQQNLAPRIEFGDDDSPRVEQLPSFLKQNLPKY